jgi:hypothetical protein
MNMLNKKVIRATFIVCNQNLFQISNHWLKIKSHKKFSRVPIKHKLY